MSDKCQVTTLLIVTAPLCPRSPVRSPACDMDLWLSMCMSAGSSSMRWLQQGRLLAYPQSVRSSPALCSISRPLLMLIEFSLSWKNWTRASEKCNGIFPIHLSISIVTTVTRLNWFAWSLWLCCMRCSDRDVYTETLARLQQTVIPSKASSDADKAVGFYALIFGASTKQLVCCDEP